VKTRTHHALLILLLAVPALAGCGRNIVRAASPSVTTPPVPRPSAPTNTEVSDQPVPPPVLPEPDPASAAPAIADNPGPTAPAAPRPRPAAPAAPAQPEPGQPQPVAPQISVALKPSDLARLERLTTEQVAIAERNAQLASNRRLNASQSDLLQKVNGFINQAHDAIKANDWCALRTLPKKRRFSR